MNWYLKWQMRKKRKIENFIDKEWNEKEKRKV